MELKKTVTILVAAATLAILICVTNSVEANDGPWAAIHDLIQNEQNVDITIAIPKSGDDSMETAYTLGRLTEGDLVLVLEKHIFDPSDIVDTVERCNWIIDIGWCDENPDECADCDGDETLECRIYELDDYGETMAASREAFGRTGGKKSLPPCSTYDLVAATDECVPAGTIVYDFLNEALEHAADHQTASIAVVDSGISCDPDGSTDIEVPENTGCSYFNGSASAAGIGIVEVLMALL